MGRSYGAICNGCGHHFEVRDGGGFFFHILHCDKCGEAKTLTFDQLGDAHLKYVKGLPGPYSEATRSLDEYVQENYPDPPLKEEQYHAIVEKTAGKHSCGGHFRMDAPPRCPKCSGVDLRDDPDAPSAAYD